MKAFFHLLGVYLRQKLVPLAATALCFGICAVVFALYGLPVEAVGYAALLCAVLLLLVWLGGFVAFYRRHTLLSALLSSVTTAELHLPSPAGEIERDYQELLRCLDDSRTALISQKDKAFTDMVEYYTIWAHQIKTPIAAMRLLLQAEPAENSGELLDQLFRIEQYVEMVLQYLRMESLNSDLLFRRVELDDIVKQAVRKYSKSFIRKKLRLEYAPLERQVLTDEKWLTFVVEQVLSNALKYTNAGTITIYMQADAPCTLVIEDTGIGIAPEDLPRVFERGYTGYNGHADKKSTGIGLYLCRRILQKLSHTIAIESTVGQGTKDKIGLENTHIKTD